MTCCQFDLQNFKQFASIASHYQNNSDVLSTILQSKAADKKPVLTTRMLLPYYKLEAVHQFMDIFAKVSIWNICFVFYIDCMLLKETKMSLRCALPTLFECFPSLLTFAHCLLFFTPRIHSQVDENFSGDLDVNEWIRLFTSLNESVPVLEARMIFMKIGT